MNTIRKFGFVATLLALLGTVLPADASTASNAIITSVAIQGTTTSPFARITFTPGTTSPPSCTVAGTAMYIPLGTAQGRAMLATAQAAFLSGKKTIVVGMGTCSVPPSIPGQPTLFSFETLGNISVSNN